MSRAFIRPLILGPNLNPINSPAVTRSATARKNNNSDQSAVSATQNGGQDDSEDDVVPKETLDWQHAESVGTLEPNSMSSSDQLGAKYSEMIRTGNYTADEGLVMRAYLERATHAAYAETQRKEALRLENISTSERAASKVEEERDLQLVKVDMYGNCLIHATHLGIHGEIPTKAITQEMRVKIINNVEANNKEKTYVYFEAGGEFASAEEWCTGMKRNGRVIEGQIILTALAEETGRDIEVITVEKANSNGGIDPSYTATYECGMAAQESIILMHCRLTNHFNLFKRRQRTTHTHSQTHSVVTTSQHGPTPSSSATTPTIRHAAPSTPSSSVSISTFAQYPSVTLSPLSQPFTPSDSLSTLSISQQTAILSATSASATPTSPTEDAVNDGINGDSETGNENSADRGGENNDTHDTGNDGSSMHGDAGEGNTDQRDPRRRECPICLSWQLVNKNRAMRKHNNSDNIECAGPPSTSTVPRSTQSSSQRTVNTARSSQDDEADDLIEHEMDNQTPQVRAQSEARTAQKAETNKNNKRRKQAIKTRAYAMQLVSALQHAAESLITPKEFGERMQLVLNMSPPGAPTVPTTESIGKEVEGAGAQNQEETIIHHDNAESQSSGSSSSDDEHDEQDIERRKERDRQRTLSKDRVKMMKDILKHTANCDMTKARRSLKQAEPRDISRKEVEEKLMAKFPRDADRGQDLAAFDPEEIIPDLEYPTEASIMVKYVKNRRNGSSRAVTGLSFDEIKVALANDENAEASIMIVTSRIAAGYLPEGNARHILLCGKGTPLQKGKPEGTDLRPVTTINPILSITSSLVTKCSEERVLRVCGISQLGLVKGGVEANGHIVINLLRADTTLFCAVFDCRNAYGSVSQPHILKNMAEKGPDLTELKNYARFTLAGQPATTTFHHRKTGKTIVAQLEMGFQQGSPSSTAIFCVGLAGTIEELQAQFPNITFVLVSDNINAVGSSRELLALAPVLEAALERNLKCKLQETKATAYSYGGVSRAVKEAFAELNIVAIEKEDGFMCAGTPVGSEEFKRKVINNQADKIIAELHEIVEIVKSTRFGSVVNTSQIMFHMVRLCSPQQFMFLQRVCPPSSTFEAASRIDTAIVNAIFQITDTLQWMPEEDTDEMREIVDQMFLRIRLGGMGMQSTRASAVHAFVASTMQNLHLIKKFSPDIDTIGSPAYETPEMREFRSLIGELRENGYTGISVADMLFVHTKSMTKVQRILADQHQQRMKDRVTERMPPQAPSGGFNIRCLNEDERSRIHQTQANSDTTANAFMNANPGVHKLNDKMFSILIGIRFGCRVIGSRRYCICGKKLDPFGNHSYVCNVKGVSTFEKHQNHSALNEYCQRMLRRVDESFRVPKSEPHLDEYLERRADGEGGVRHRGDFIMIPNDGSTPTIYDATCTSPIAENNNQSNTINTLVPGAAAEKASLRKDEHYNKFYVPNPQRCMVKAVAMETTGGMSAELRALIKMVAEEIVKKKGNQQSVASTMQFLTQEISVEFAEIRVRAVLRQISRTSLDNYPTYRASNGQGELTRPPTPAYIGRPENRQREEGLSRAWYKDTNSHARRLWTMEENRQSDATDSGYDGASESDDGQEENPKTPLNSSLLNEIEGIECESWHALSSTQDSNQLGGSPPCSPSLSAQVVSGTNTQKSGEEDDSSNRIVLRTLSNIECVSIQSNASTQESPMGSAQMSASSETSASRNNGENSQESTAGSSAAASSRRSMSSRINEGRGVGGPSRATSNVGVGRSKEVGGRSKKNSINTNSNNSNNSNNNNITNRNKSNNNVRNSSSKV